MSVKETPLQAVKRLYGSKDKLIDAVVKALTAVDDDQPDDLKERLTPASNKKLLRLADVANQIKERYGDKEKMIEAFVASRNMSKDSDFATALSELPAARIYDMTASAEHRAAKGPSKPRHRTNAA